MRNSSPIDNEAMADLHHILEKRIAARHADTDPSWQRQFAIYEAAYDTLEKGAPGLSKITREVMARSISQKAIGALKKLAETVSE